MTVDPVLSYLSRPAPEVAPGLLGWRLTAHGVSGIIAETEAYQGEEDLACHAAKGRTPRTATLYAAPGTIYVYLCYGMHHLLNLVTDREGVPSAVLIRGSGLKAGVLTPESARAPSITLCVTAWTFN